MMNVRPSQPPGAFPWRWGWLYPATYLIHIAEEHAGGFATLIGRAGLAVSPQYFLAANAVLWVGMAWWVHVARRREAPWMLLALATIVVINGLTHLIASLALRTYAPGLLSGLVLWWPLGIRTLAAGRRTVERRQLRLGVGAGVLVHALLPRVLVAGSRG